MEDMSSQHGLYDHTTFNICLANRKICPAYREDMASLKGGSGKRAEKYDQPT